MKSKSEAKVFSLKQVLKLIILFFEIFKLVADFDYFEEVKGYAESNRGRAMLVDQRGYVYQINRFAKGKNSGNVFWQCQLRRKKEPCKVGAVSRQNKIIKITGVHNHPPPIGSEDSSSHLPLSKSQFEKLTATE